MNCNQPFRGIGFSDGPFFSPPLYSTQSMYPEIVGEGEVTSVTLPDGTVQLFFMPTLKWWPPYASQCQPYPTIANPMFANTNSSIPAYNNVGTWFIRRICNTLPLNGFNVPSQRNQLPSNAINMSTHDFGYKVKFHNDSWTSTTDLVYFYPSLRQRDFVFTPPCYDKTVQIDAGPVANKTTCYHEVLCSNTKCTCCVCSKPMSLDSLVDPKLTTKSNNSNSNRTTTDDCYKRGKNKKVKWYKPKNTVCHCHSTAKIDCTADKSVTTYAEKGSCTPKDGRKTQTSAECCDDSKPIINKTKEKQKLRFSESYSSCSTPEECNCDDVTKKHKQHKHITFKLNKSKKCDCGCESTSSCVSEPKTVESKADECQTPFSIISACCFKTAAQDPPSQQNTAVDQWLNSDDVCPQCNPSLESINIWSKTALE